MPAKAKKAAMIEEELSRSDELNEITALVSENIAKARKLARWKQSEVAAKLGVSVQSISQWERGATDPKHETLGAMARLFKLPGGGLWFYQVHPDGPEDPLKPQELAGTESPVTPAPVLPVTRVPAPSHLTAEEREKWALFNRFLEFERGAAGGEDCLRFLNEAITTPLSRLFIEQAEGRIARAREKKPA